MTCTNQLADIWITSFVLTLVTLIIRSRCASLGIAWHHRALNRRALCGQQKVVIDLVW